MVHFITSQGKNENVEMILEYVNNYINFNSLTNIEDKTDSWSVQRDYNDLLALVGKVNASYAISVNRPIMVQGKFAKCKIFIMRLIRKCIRWYINDLAIQQTEFNAEIVRYINQEVAVIGKMKTEMTRLHEANKLLEGEKIPENWYVNFENHFRGSVDEISQRMGIYVDLFREKESVLDIGCGRGEFLRLMKNNSISARGVDINGEMVRECKEAGLDVEQGDGLEYLRAQDNESLGGIMMCQIVEHLTTEKLYFLLEAAYKKLKKAGILVLETVNPLTLGVFCYGFYIDPTHTEPIHPAMLRFMAESIGFKVEPVEFLHEFPTEYKFELNENMSQETVPLINKLNKQVFGAQDYYLVCRKVEE